MSDTIFLARSVGEDKVLQLERRSLLHHTLVVGQSGSGKSFLVARLLEEILLRSRARVIIIDPNGDYRKLREPSESAWSKFAPAFRSYSEAAREARLPDYDQEDRFASAWARISHRTLIASANQVDELSDESGKVYERRLFVHWFDLHDDEQDAILNIRDLRPELIQLFNALRDHQREQQYHNELHELIAAIDRLQIGDIKDDPLIQKVFKAVTTMGDADWLTLRLPLKTIWSRHRALWYSREFASEPTSVSDYLGQAFHPLLRKEASAWRYLTLVLDSIESRDMLLAVDIGLSTIWNQARRATLQMEVEHKRALAPRYPTFIVLDEAHRFIPEEPQGDLQERVTNHILQIASEGRKYGLYLILASQRPSKLHPAVVPECENSSILRLQSPHEIAFARDKLGVDTVISAALPRFRQGRAMIHGQWSPNAHDVIIAPARTTLGGAGLGSEWLKDPLRESPPSIRQPKSVASLNEGPSGKRRPRGRA